MGRLYRFVLTPESRLPLSAARLDSTPRVREEDGATVALFEKDVIREGVFRHPSDRWTLVVTPQRMDAWVKNTQAAIASGVNIRLSKDHEPGSDGTIGSVKSVRRKGDRIVAVVEAVGQRSIDLVRQVGQVSIELDENFVSGSGVSFGECIVAVSLTPSPVVHRQGPFRRIAASLESVHKEEKERQELLSEMVRLAYPGR
ncbi:MAG: hypothetical protein JSV19_00215 [Phycisphaerales bacterium]|nr:MAG: hypothetical protein JSV19_00215 [Phycisphaerales bacterium]